MFHKKTMKYVVGFFVFGIVYWLVTRLFYHSRIANSRVEGLNTTKNEIRTISIPLHIYQTWNTKELPEKMKECVENLKKKNPDFEHHLFDDNDMYEFIKTHFEKDVLDAYDKIIPGAYRADLWRYCVLYIHGGVYLDIKYTNVGDFNLLEMTDREYFCIDIEKSGGGIYNAFMICKPKNEKLWKCIQQIVENVNTKYYGETGLHPTGPMLMKSQFTEEELAEITKNGLEICENDCPTKTCICRNGKPILSIYKEYYEKEVNITTTKRYYELWGEKKIYKE